ncbi:efflux RND transporter permease subunit [Shewanella sp. SM34]|uniref:efflux RND transporter permease subunit n=1 Tax=unclassified Shewanella TaxID=196818 RepID=UPI0021D89780|nr:MULTISPECIES: efflux RND transporter permease subunit [unclassified Shewanella]MCU8055639.1 efflux RND transporter permease subunit [Shewanella sp. SM35]MCU8064698.1 efflux RND transporter permease subunit [Shewanella sp. SM34]
MLKFGIKHGTLLSVIVLIFCVLGTAVALRIPIQMIPDLDVRTISVATGWPGATPQDVEKEILLEQERYLRTLPNLQRMTSWADTGSAWIELEFPQSTEISDALIRVSNALSQVSSYPENVDQPRLYSSSYSDNAFMYFRLVPVAGNPLNLDIDMMRDFANDFIRPQMERVKGVSSVTIQGGAERQIQIRLDPAKLAQRGISIMDVRQAIRDRNKDTSAGDIDSGKKRYLLRVIGRFEDLNQLKQLILKRQGNTNILLQDVAEIKLDHAEIRELSFAEQERTLSLAVKRDVGSNVIAIKDAMMPVVAQINQNQLAQHAMQLELFSDDVRYVQDSVENVWVNLGLGALLATLVMYLFLRSNRATLIGVIGIPLCTLAAFVGLLVFDRTINVISLAGVAFAIGMTVDNSIVVLESIEQARRRGLERIEAAISGIYDVWPAVLASTLTTVLVFVPILFIKQEAGQLYSDIAIAIASSIIASMLVAVFIVPAAIARFGFGKMHSAQTNQSEPPKASRILSLVSQLVLSARRRTFVIVLSLVSTIGLAAWLMPPAEYLPEGEEPKAFTSMVAPPGYNLSEMAKIAEELTTQLSARVNAEAASFERGEQKIPPLKYYTLSVGVGSIWVMSEPVRSQDMDAMMSSLTALFEQYPGMRAYSSRGSIISSNDGGTRAVALDISGPNQASLYRAAEAAYQAAEKVFAEPQLYSDPSTLSLDQPLWQISPRWQRLVEQDFSGSEFGYAVSALSDGAYVDEFFLNDNKVDIFLLSLAGNQQSLSQLALAPIVTPKGNVLPLQALADISEQMDSDSLRRVDGRRTVTLYIIPPRSIALETAVAKVREELVPILYQQGAVGKDVSLDISGAADQLEATKAALSSNFLVAVLIIYLLLVAIFNHWGYPLFVLITIPLGLAGGLIGLQALNSIGSLFAYLGGQGWHQPFDMITMLGFLILLGTVVNNPILIVEQSRKNLQSGQLGVVDAVKSAVASRLRPILMSTATTLFGLLPLVLFPGAGSELYRGVGIVVLAGLIVATLLSLTFLPALLISVLSRTHKTNSAEVAHHHD